MRFSRFLLRAYVLLTSTVLLFIALAFVLYPVLIHTDRTALWDDDASHGHVQFKRDWCRLQKQRTDWYEMLIPCQGRLKWTSRELTTNRTDAKKSYISSWKLKPAGHFSRFFIQSVDSQGKRKTFGGDSWRVYIREGPSSLAPVVFDLNNGLYEVLFLPLKPGVYTARVWLDYTMCDGLREPPAGWFINGTDYSTYRSPQDGILGYIGDDYINQHLHGKSSQRFSVKGTCLECPISKLDSSVQIVMPMARSQCEETCPKLLWDGHGLWTGGTWQPYKVDGPGREDSARTTKDQINASGTFWIYGDSLGLRLLNSIRSRPLCGKIFKECQSTYNWIYEVKDKTEPPKIESDFDQSIILNNIRAILEAPSMNNPDSVFLFNLGVHFPISITFETYQTLVDSLIQLLKERHYGGDLKYKAMPVWKTTTVIEKEKVTRQPWPARPLNFTMFRFLTTQRLQLFNKYAMQAMCQADIPVLDVNPLSASYVNGTEDYVHYDSKVFRPVEDFLHQFFKERKRKR